MAVCTRVCLLNILMAVITMACGLATFSPETVSASDARLERAMQFGEQLLDRECRWSSSGGGLLRGRGAREAFDRQRLPDEAVSPYVVPISGVLRSDRAAVAWTNSDPGSDAPATKLVATRERVATINYQPGDAQLQDEYSSFTERPLGDTPFDGYASCYTDGIWFGYLANYKFPEFSRLVSMVEWETSGDGNEVRGTFEGWELLFVFADAAAELPVRVKMRDLADSPLEPGVMMARTIEFLEWDDYAGITCPRKVGVWYLAYLKSEEWLTTYSEYTLESVGPVMELSDRYGDYFTDVPNGVSVQVDDYMGIEFIWEDGEIVRKVDREKLSSLIGQPFFGSPLRRFVLMGAGVCVLAAAGWFLYRRSSTAGGSRVS